MGLDTARRDLRRSALILLVMGALFLAVAFMDSLLGRVSWTTRLLAVDGAGALFVGGLQLRSQRYRAWWMRRYDQRQRRRAEKLRQGG